jgi:hypothetical protein
VRAGLAGNQNDPLEQDVARFAAHSSPTPGDYRAGENQPLFIHGAAKLLLHLCVSVMVCDRGSAFCSRHSGLRIVTFGHNTGTSLLSLLNKRIVLNSLPEFKVTVYHFKTGGSRLGSQGLV